MKDIKLETLIPNAVALAMGVVSIVLTILKESQETIITLLAIAVLCLGFVGINNIDK
jgi:hypothetical protein